jgi:hypothetical protein
MTDEREAMPDQSFLEMSSNYAGDVDAIVAHQSLDERVRDFLVNESRKANAEGAGIRCFCVIRRAATLPGLRWRFTERMRMLREAFRL